MDKEQNTKPTPAGPDVKDFLQAAARGEAVSFCSKHRKHLRKSSDNKLYLITRQGWRRVDSYFEQQPKVKAA